MIFGSFINWSVYLFLVYEYVNNKFPEKTQTFFINLSYYCIYFFSKLQIFLNKQRNDIYLYLENNENYSKYIQKTIEIKSNISNKFMYYINLYFYKNYDSNLRKNESDKKKIIFDFILDNKINFSMFKEELIDNLEATVMDNALLDSCDFVIVTDSNNNNKIVNKDLISLTNLKSEDSALYKITPINYKPILFEMIVGPMNIKISFTSRDNDFNYLVVDNNFDSNFLQYFMKKYYRYDLKDGTEYELKVLDDNIETISIGNSDILKITENKLIKI